MNRGRRSGPTFKQRRRGDAALHVRRYGSAIYPSFVSKAALVEQYYILVQCIYCYTHCTDRTVAPQPAAARSQRLADVSKSGPDRRSKARRAAAAK